MAIEGEKERGIEREKKKERKTDKQRHSFGSYFRLLQQFPITKCQINNKT